MDAADLIASFSTSPAGRYAVTRRSRARTDGRGRAVAGPASTIQIVASVQAATGRDLMRLPEGRRAVETRVVFTATELLVGGQGAANEADLVNIDGKTWEVQHSERWAESPPSDPTYWRCVVQVSQ